VHGILARPCDSGLTGLCDVTAMSGRYGNALRENGQGDRGAGLTSAPGPGDWTRDLAVRVVRHRLDLDLQASLQCLLRLLRDCPVSVGTVTAFDVCTPTFRLVPGWMTVPAAGVVANDRAPGVCGRRLGSSNG